MTIEFLYRTIGDVLLFTTCIWALWRGEAPERLGAAFLLIAVALTDLVQTRHLYRDGPVWDFIVVDIGALLAFVGLSLWSRRIWTLFISAFQLNAVLSHFVGRLPIHVDTYTLITALSLWGGYGLTFALMAGMWQMESRRKASLP
jgi:hypothetical protein